MTSESRATSDLARLLDRGYGAWNRDDREAWIEVLHPEIEFWTSGLFPGFDEVYRGHAGMRRFWDAMKDPWEVFELLPDADRIVTLGDEVMVPLHFHGRGRATGIDVQLEMFHVGRLEDGMLRELIAVGEEEAAQALFRDRAG